MLKKLTIMLVFVLLFLTGCSEGNNSVPEGGFPDPVQEKCSVEPIQRQEKDFIYQILPKASYEIVGKVVSTKKYSSGIGLISPVDFAIVWGQLASPEYEGKVTYSHGNRYYRYRYKKESGVDGKYIATHSSNNHIVPADEEIEKQVLSVKKGDTVHIKGYLANIEGTMNDRPFKWNTSLKRTDTGNGACEVIFVEKIYINQQNPAGQNSAGLEKPS